MFAIATKCVEVSRKRQDFLLYRNFGLMASVCRETGRFAYTLVDLPTRSKLFHLQWITYNVTVYK